MDSDSCDDDDDGGGVDDDDDYDDVGDNDDDDDVGDDDDDDNEDVVHNSYHFVFRVINILDQQINCLFNDRISSWISQLTLYGR